MSDKWKRPPGAEEYTELQWVISASNLMLALQAAHSGTHPEMVYLELLMQSTMSEPSDRTDDGD